jgi:hypothetical protein
MKPQKETAPITRGSSISLWPTLTLFPPKIVVSVRHGSKRIDMLLSVDEFYAVRRAFDDVALQITGT